MNWKDLTLSDIECLVRALEQANTHPDIVRAVIDRVQAEPMVHGRVTIDSLFQLLQQTNGSTVLPDEIVTQLNAPEPMPVAPVIPPPVVTSRCLRLLTDQPLIIGPTDGSEVLADAADVFTYIDPDFRDWKANEPGKPTAAMPAMVYEQVQDANLAKMFGSLSPDVAKLCLTQAQIKAFVQQRDNWLRTDGYVTLFLFQSFGHFFVAAVNFNNGDRLVVSVHHFGLTDSWDTQCHHRVVVPQLA